MPDLTGIKIEPETAARLSEHQNIIGMKDSSNDVANFGRGSALRSGQDFAMMIGNGTVFQRGVAVRSRAAEFWRSVASCRNSVWKSIARVRIPMTLITPQRCRKTDSARPRGHQDLRRRRIENSDGNGRLRWRHGARATATTERRSAR